MSSPIDLSRLPVPDIIEVLDYEHILAERKAALVALFDAADQAEVAMTLTLESEPLTKFLQESAMRELLLRNRVNDAARAVMLAYSRGADLDQLGANVNTERLLIAPADLAANPPTPAVYESDEAFQLRIQESFDGLSVAGPGAAYRFFARSADGRVADASAFSPSPCEVVVTVLSTDNDGVASQALLDIVAAALSPEEVRPIGDRVTVQSAEIIPYQNVATIYIGSGPESSIILAAAIERLTAVVNQKRKLGRSIYRSAHTAALHVEGVKKVVLHEPAEDVIVTLAQAARSTGINIVVAVLDE